MTLRLEARQPKSRIVTIEWTKDDKLQTALYRVRLERAMVSNIVDFGTISSGPGATRIGLNFEKLTFEFAVSTEPLKAP